MIEPDELLKLHKAATSGPWEVVDARAFLDDEDFEIRNGGHCIGYGTSEQDAAYIVAACNNAPELAEEVKALKKALDLLVKWNFPVYSCLECPARESCDGSARPCIAVVVEHAIKEARSGNA